MSDETRLVQVTTVHASERKLPRGSRPVLELHLREGQTIVGVHNYWVTDLKTRETVDHHANFWVATEL